MIKQNHGTILQKVSQECKMPPCLPVSKFPTRGVAGEANLEVTDGHLSLDILAASMSPPQCWGSSQRVIAGAMRSILDSSAKPFLWLTL